MPELESERQRPTRSRAPSPELSPVVRDAITGPEPGSRLPSSVSGALTSSFGADLSAVRVHNDSAANSAAGHLGVRAFTWGSDIFLGHGQSSSDLGLVAHEVGHAIQQQGGPAVHLFGGAHGDLEHEAQQGAAAAMRGERFAITGRTSAPAVQREEKPWYARALSTVTDAGSAVLATAVNYVKDKAASIPGYPVLGFALGRDPITQQPVDRTPGNLIRAALTLVPGGTEIYDNLQRSQVIQRVAEWLSGEIGKLAFTWPYIRGLFEQARDSLSATDLLSPGQLWDKVRAVFGPPVGRIVDFARSAATKLPEFVVEGALALAGPAGQQVLDVFRRARGVFGLIAADPGAFLRHLLDGAFGGIRQFGANIMGHLKTGIFEWLTGTLGPSVKLPQKWDFGGILGLVLDVLGVGYATLRSAMVTVMGEPAVRAAEETFEFVRTVATKGLAAGWQQLREHLTDLADTVIGTIREWAITSLVKSGITKLASMFTPVGAIVQAVVTAYNTVMFFIERANQIGRVVTSVLDSVEPIARGDTSKAANAVEKAMASTLPVILGFLGRFLGLGSVTEPVRKAISDVRGRITGAVQKVAHWVKVKVGALQPKSAAESSTTPAQLDQQAGALPAEPFDVGEEHHRLYFVGDGPEPEIYVASRPNSVLKFLDAAEDTSAISDRRKEDIGAARVIARRVNKAAKEFKTRRWTAAAKQRVAGDQIALSGILKRLLDKVPLRRFNEKYRIEGIVSTYETAPSQKGDKLTADHQPQAAVLKAIADEPAFEGTHAVSVATGHARGGWTIVLHHFRHIAGRTYGNSALVGAARAAIKKAVRDNKGNKSKQREAVLAVAKDELRKDVSAVRALLGQDEVWRDIRGRSGPADPADKEALVRQVKSQIRSGEDLISRQPIDKLGEKE